MGCITILLLALTLILVFIPGFSEIVLAKEYWYLIGIFWLACGIIRLLFGDIIDTIVDERNNHTSDSFTNTYTISLVDKETGKEKTWPSEKGFHGPIKTDGTKLTSPLVEQAAYAWELAYGRPPTRKEIELGGQICAAEARYQSLVA